LIVSKSRYIAPLGYCLAAFFVYPSSLRSVLLAWRVAGALRWVG
jgi:hypothetical protein